MRFLSILASILGPNMGSPKVGPLDIFSAFSSRYVQDAPRRVQDVSRTPLSPPKTPPRHPRLPKDTSELTQIALKHPKSATI